MDDQFRIIEGYPVYRVSRGGEVQSRWGRRGQWALTEAWRLLAPVRRRGYLTVNLSDGTRKRQKYIHRLVVEAFLGPCPEGMVCRHLDGDRENNRVENLARGTYSENEADKLRHGTWLMGEEISEKLTEADVLEIRMLRGKGARFAGLADTYGVSRQNVAKIVYRESWRHLP